MSKTGTREWAEVNKNIQKGCEHGCLYCYAYSNAKRFKQINNRKEWLNPKLNYGALNKKPYKAKGRIMYPTTHDILPQYINENIEFLKKWLEIGNEILIVSKPHFACIRRLVNSLQPYKKQIVFRFTIGSIHSAVLKFWEPGAPDFYERLRSLKVAFNQGYQTSVSVEPYLDGEVEMLFHAVKPYVSDTVWIGKMNRIGQRVDQSNWSHNDMKFLDRVRRSQTDEAVWNLYNNLKDEPKVRWKDSIKRVIGIPEDEVVG